MSANAGWCCWHAFLDPPGCCPVPLAPFCLSVPAHSNRRSTHSCPTNCSSAHQSTIGVYLDVSRPLQHPTSKPAVAAEFAPQFLSLPLGCFLTVRDLSSKEDPAKGVQACLVLLQSLYPGSPACHWICPATEIHACLPGVATEFGTQHTSLSLGCFLTVLDLSSKEDPAKGVQACLVFLQSLYLG